MTVAMIGCQQGASPAGAVVVLVVGLLGVTVSVAFLAHRKKHEDNASQAVHQHAWQLYEGVGCCKHFLVLCYRLEAAAA